MDQPTLSRDYFEQIYRDREDPWHFETSDYELAKYRDTLNAIPRPRYARALEIGCSIGVQTAMLAARCEHLVAIDTSELAIARAEARCGGLSHIEFLRMTVPGDYPSGLFDLTVCSEVGYYFTAADLAILAREIFTHSQPAGHLLLVHWTPFAPDHPLSADQVHDLFLAQPGWKSLFQPRREHYRLDLLERTER